MPLFLPVVALASALAAPQPLAVTPVRCEELPDAVRGPMCLPGLVSGVLEVRAGKRLLYVARDARDERPSDGPYLERLLAWEAGKTVSDLDAIGQVTDLVTGLGPVVDDADATNRLRLYAFAAMLSDGRIPVDLPAHPEPCGAPNSGWKDTSRCGISHPSPDLWTATLLSVDASACECTVNWTKVEEVTFRLNAAGGVDLQEKQVFCAADPEKNTRDVCGK